jgi:predicted fused transcriptional regulator/phosphomethylpyrimidine kinase
VSENSEITQLVVTIATNFPQLTCCMNVKYVDHKRASSLLFLISNGFL